MTEVRMHYMDLLAACRIAAAQARKDGMPMCAARHEADATALETALALANNKSREIKVVFY